MSYYLVTATPRAARMGELEARLRRSEFRPLRPFGKALSHSLENARLRPDGIAVWEEEDYCSPPLDQERRAVLDDYFDDLGVETVRPNEGWRRIEALPVLFPALAGAKGD
jgi:hypothetical protein